MARRALRLVAVSLAVLGTSAQCPDYVQYSSTPHPPYSTGRYNLSYQRPIESCRTVVVPEVEEAIKRVQGVITDPDLRRLFENVFPNTLDTAVRWRGTAKDSDEELTFLITGDINAMWLRDSANQMQSYLPLLKSANSTLASLFRGVINLQARYIIRSPYCNSFQPPVESGIMPMPSGGGNSNTIKPDYSAEFVWECKYELDSLAAFLQISADYYAATKDAAFFGRYKWLDAVRSLLRVADEMQFPTYAANGSVNPSPYIWIFQSDSATETQANRGRGSPVGNLAGLVRSFFRPSDDATIFQGFIPANMQFSTNLNASAAIAAQLPADGAALAAKMAALARQIRTAIDTIGTTTHPTYGRVYAFETDGYGSYNLMDDANIPSLLAAPMLGYTTLADPVYQNTRRMVLSAANPYFMRGPVLTAVGGPHAGLGYPWPMAAIVRILTSTDEEEVYGQLRQLVATTDGLGLIHEGVNSLDAADYTRPWFSWVNGLFGQMVLDLETRMPALLKRSYQ